MLSLLETPHRIANLVNDAHSLMPQNCARCTSRNVTLRDVQIRTAYCRLGELDNCIGGMVDLRLRPFLQLHVANCSIDECLHCGVGSLADCRSKDMAV